MVTQTIYSSARLALALAVLAASEWQCNQCGARFQSDTPSQTCGSCS
ncbi:hypothetical protein [Streptomyces sp. NPDC051662]